MSTQANFNITYGGPALDDNEMDVRELAPSLVAIADLIEESNNVINGGGTKVVVNVKGSFKSGSFSIDFSLIQDVYQNIINFFSSDDITAAANLLTLIGLAGAGGLIGFLKKLKNRKIKEISNQNDREVLITITDEEKIKIDSRILDLYKDLRIREAIEKIICKPLSKDGIDYIKTSNGDDLADVSIDKSEKEYFSLPLLEDEVLGENFTEAYLQLVSISFKEDNKWRFSRGELVFFATILDDEFLGKINRNEIQFSKDDILKVRLKAKDILTGVGIRTEYAVVEVLEHRSSYRQLKLPTE